MEVGIQALLRQVRNEKETFLGHPRVPEGDLFPLEEDHQDEEVANSAPRLPIGGPNANTVEGDMKANVGC